MVMICYIRDVSAPQVFLAHSEWLSRNRSTHKKRTRVFANGKERMGLEA